MATKTLTIMEDVYQLLVDNKQKEESFSDELRRILSKKKSKHLRDFLGIISKEEGDLMLKDLDKVRSENIKILNNKLK
tara:strand:+ start:26111 stop:26344 length:234 start_codon:yes stop_codon:yes gene_type:complete